ncbi:MAG TPA: hypothetical protein VGU64_14285, partial [Terriglobales bacterium]|nr:hypothetical protein [Terriglobales bacterium]
VRTYVRQAFVLPLALTMPLIAVLLLMRHWFVAHSYLQLGIQLLVGFGIYALGLVWAIWTHKAWQVEGIHDEETARETAMALVETYQQEEA